MKKKIIFSKKRGPIYVFLSLLSLIPLTLFFTGTVEGSGQLLCDPGFENSTANGTFPNSGCWSPSSAGGGAYACVTTTAAHNGNNGLWVYTGDETGAYWSRPYQQFNAEPGQVYSASGWIRTPSGEDWVDGSIACIRIEFLDVIGNKLSIMNSSGVTTPNTSWDQYLVVSNPAPAGTIYVRFICDIEKPDGSPGISVANIDDTLFELSTDNHPPNIPGNPSPTQGDTGVSITPTLTWTGGDPDSGDTVAYDVYFGTGSNPALASSNLSAASYIPGTLAYSTTYYWKVVVTDSHGAQNTGPVWSFTTINNAGISLAYGYLYKVMDKFQNTFDVYTDEDQSGNHYFPSGWIGDISAIDLDTDWPTDSHSGSSCIRVTFTANGDNWAGIYWQEPENNWGTVPNGGYNLEGASKVTFWARGENGGEKVEFFVGGIQGQYPDSLAKMSTGYVTLTNSWYKYTINLSGDLSNVVGGFGWVTNSPNNPDGATFYIDDIKYDKSRYAELRFLESFETLPIIDPDRYIKRACYIYDNALVLMAFLSRGSIDDLRRAKILADAFIYAQNNDRFYSDGRLRDAYMSGDLIDHITGKARLPGWWDPVTQEWYEDEFQVSTETGNLAWTIIALLSYYEKEGGIQYLEAAESIGEWIETETKDTVGAGGYTGGFLGWEPAPQKITWKSTEHNIDLYVAFTLLNEITGDENWNERALHAKAFVEAMWDAKNNHFWTGTLDDGVTVNSANIPMDIQAWSILALNDYKSAIVWVENNCYTEKDGFKGFDFNTDQDGVWFEGTAQMALAYQISEEGNKSDTYIAELRKAQENAENTDGEGIVAASHDGVTTGFDWKYFSRLHIGATAWYIFASIHYNPYWGDRTIPQAVIAVNPTSYDYGNVATGQSSEFTVAITNNGNADLIVGDIAYTNPLNAPFSIESDNCSNQTIMPSASCSFMVRFTPSTSGSFNDSFDIPSNDHANPSVVVSVTGVSNKDNGGGGCFIMAIGE